jgi:hypothetical protein
VQLNLLTKLNFLNSLLFCRNTASVLLLLKLVCSVNFNSFLLQDGLQVDLHDCNLQITEKLHIGFRNNCSKFYTLWLWVWDLRPCVQTSQPTINTINQYEVLSVYLYQKCSEGGFIFYQLIGWCSFVIQSRIRLSHYVFLVALQTFRNFLG